MQLFPVMAAILIVTAAICCDFAIPEKSEIRRVSRGISGRRSATRGDSTSVLGKPRQQKSSYG